jgi:outer membrane protein
MNLFLDGRAALTLFALAMIPATASALDLVGSYQRALQTDPTTRAAVEALAGGREKAIQGDALLLPQIGLSAQSVYVNDRSNTTLPPALQDIITPESAGTLHQVALQLKHPLYDAKAAADRTQLHEQTHLAEIRFRDAQQNLVGRVADAYFNVLLAQENLRVVLAEKAAVAMQRDRAQARFEVGRGKVTEVQETQARYDAVMTREVSANSTLEMREAQFQELTGVPARGLAELPSRFTPSPPQPDNLTAWQQRGVDRNTFVLTRQSERAIASAEIAKYKLSSRPTLDLVGSYTYKTQSGGLSPVIAPDSNRAAVIGVQLTVPLYTGGALDSREREARARERQAELEIAAAQRDVRLQVQDAYLAVKTGVSRIASVEQSLLSARTALEATTLGRDVGSRTELDVLDAQQRVYSTQLELAQARNDYLLGRIRLAAAAGELDVRELEALNGYLAR